MIADFEGDITELLKDRDSGTYPIICTRDLVIFPTVLTPIILGRKQSIAVVDYLKQKHDDLIFCAFTQKDANLDDPEKEDLYETGVFCRLIKMVELPGQQNGQVTIVVQGLGKCKLKSIDTKRPFYSGYVENISEEWPKNTDTEFKLLQSSLFSQTIKLIQDSDEIPDDAEYAINSISNPLVRTNFILSSMPFSIEEKIKMLEMDSMTDRMFEALKYENRLKQLFDIQSDIRQKTKNDLDEQQREYFLQQQLKNIKKELGGNDMSPEKKEILEKAKSKNWNENIEKIFNKEFKRLDTLHPQSPDYSTQINYLQTMVDLPWNDCTIDNLSLKHAKKVLDKDHYGMEKVKERILEYLAVRALRDDLKSPILCLYGPPGVGKTSLGKSIAQAMGRKYVRVSLGGLHDEAEIRGHRFNGDPSSALLEVLDPEQNKAFHDNYLDIDYDLSKVLFIATANDLSSIPRPLLDRMELIEVGGYITEEKVEIAKRHLIPRELENTGLKKYTPKIKFSKAAIEKIIEQYTRESGVRQLEKQINKALRKMAFKLAYEDILETTNITPAEVATLLGNPPFNRDIYQGNAYAGVVTGLAWTSVGGEILFIETSLSKGKAGKLTLTGNLGDVMKESAVIALEYVKAHIDLLGVDYRIFSNWNIHIHVPEGATPKDGPSAGITIATSIASAITQRKVRKNTAMTGEITLRGKVLPVGGIKEKILAAKRAGITDIVMCQANQKDIEEIPEQYRKGVEFHYVENVADVWKFALTDEKVEHPVDFTIDEEEEEENKK